MPDAEGNLKADSGTETTLHAYKQESGGGSSDPHREDVAGDPTGGEVLQDPIDERQDPGKH